MSDENKTNEELLAECNRLANYLNVHPFCYQDESLTKLNRRPDPINSSHVEWTPGTTRISTHIKYFTEKYPFYEWEMKEVPHEFFEAALRTLYTSIKSEAILKAKSELPEKELNRLATEVVENMLEKERHLAE